jgi:hypothetical protein
VTLPAPLPHGATSAAVKAVRWWFEGSCGGPPAGRIAARQSRPPSALSKRHWHALGPADDVPVSTDGLWLAVAAATPQQHESAAALFDVMALVQSPRVDRCWPELMQLPDARWAASVAAIQPFERLMTWHASAPAGAVRGILELRPRVATIHHGLWDRCILGWPPLLLQQLHSAQPPVPGISAEPAPSARRALRCWQQCLTRVALQP